MEKTATLILDSRQIENKIRRMAYQVYEQNSEENEIILAGIKNSGYKLAERLKEVLTDISTIKVILGEVKLDKKNPLAGIESSLKNEECRDKVVILVDDVLNSGSTIMYGARYFMSVPLKKLQTLVLVNRSHKKYPINADYKGILLSTSLNEMVQVSFGKESKVELY